MRIVVAPDKFKGSLPAPGVARAIADGLLAGNPGLDVAEMPVADGGEGTVAAALSAGFELVPVTAAGPLGEPVGSAFAIRAGDDSGGARPGSGGVAVIELADVVGLQRLPAGAMAPLRASTFGLGQVIASALDRGVSTVILGVGGSSSTDGGAGMMQALGVRLRDAAGAELGRGGAALAELASIDTSGLDPRLAGVTVLVASDVDNPLLGSAGAAAVFGPQKGATAEQVRQLDLALARWAALTTRETGRDMAGSPGAGSAGGTGFAALAYLGAALRPGIDLVLELIGLDGALDNVDLVITGEGSLDAQSLLGKAPVGVARAASRRGVPVVAVAGRCSLTSKELTDFGLGAAYSLTALEPDAAVSMRDAPRLLAQIGEMIARQLGCGPLADLLRRRQPTGEGA